MFHNNTASLSNSDSERRTKNTNANVTKEREMQEKECRKYTPIVAIDELTNQNRDRPAPVEKRRFDELPRYVGSVVILKAPAPTRGKPRASY